MKNRIKESKEECSKGQEGELTFRMGRGDARRNIRKVKVAQEVGVSGGGAEGVMEEKQK